MQPRRQRRGANAVEFGLWIPVLFVLFAGLVDLSWLMSRYQNVVRAARDGARVGVAIIEDDDDVPGSVMGPVAEDHAKAILDGVGMTCDTGCTVEAKLINDGSDMLEVRVVYPFEPLIGFLPLKTDMKSQFTMMVQQQS